MNCHAVPGTLILAGMLCASSALAGTEVIKCTDRAGHVTLTDQPCQPGTEQEPLAPAAEPPGVELNGAPLPAAIRTAPQRYLVTALPPARRPLPAVKSAAPAQLLAGDVATLKAARLNMLLMDNGVVALRQQGIARIR